ncbi:MAG: DUF4340 domain-containing protein [Bdellovibrionota bacterium]
MNSKSAGSLKTNLVLAAVLATLSGFAYWYEFQKKGEREKASEAKTKLIALKEDQELESVKIVDKEKNIDIEMRCAESCKLSDPNAKWQITSPIAFKADEGNVGTFATTIASATIQETLPVEGDLETKLKDYGLSKESREQRKVALKFKSDPEPYTVYLGDAAAVGDNIYAYLDRPGAETKGQNNIFIIPGHVRTTIQRDLSYWRAKRIFPFAASEVRALALKNQNGRVVLNREKDGNWFLSATKPADNEAVDTFVTGLVFMNAQEYVSDNKRKDGAKFGLAGNPKYSLDVKLADGRAHSLNVHEVLENKEPKLYATLGDKDFVIELDRTHAEKFGKKEEAFRFRNLITTAEKSLIKKVQVTLNSKDRFEFQNEADAWKLASGKLDGFDPASVDQALTRIGAARVAEFLGKKPVPGGNSEVSSWKLFDKEGKLLRTFVIYGTGDKGDYYIKLSTGELGKLERGSGSAIPSKPESFQKVPSPARK